MTGSIHVTVLPLTDWLKAMWLMLLEELAPCQCLTLGGIHTTSPVLIYFAACPHSCTSPEPLTTIKVCPAGWVCQKVRAPGSNVTMAPPIGVSVPCLKLASISTRPEKLYGEAIFVGSDPACDTHTSSACVGEINPIRQKRHASCVFMILSFSVRHALPIPAGNVCRR